MKTMHISMLTLTSLALATGLFAQTESHSHDHSAQKATPTNKMAAMSGMMDDKMMAHCKEMMKKHDQMQMDMKTMDEKLDGLVVTMNAASSTGKVDATAAVVSEMVTQRKVMQEKMSAMQTDMMQHMMQHMQMGKKSMMMCPMMQGMQTPSSGTKTPDDHAKHHQP